MKNRLQAHEGSPTLGFRITVILILEYFVTSRIGVDEGLSLSEVSTEEGYNRYRDVVSVIMLKQSREQSKAKQKAYTAPHHIPTPSPAKHLGIDPGESSLRKAWRGLDNRQSRRRFSESFHLQDHIIHDKTKT